MTASCPTPVRGWIALAIVACALLATGCSGHKQASPVGAGTELPDQEVTDFVLTETDQGRPQWTLYARYAATYQAKNLVMSHDIRVDFFDDKGARSSELTAHEGEIQQQTRDMTARGHVVMQTTEGTRMTTEELHFNNDRQQITSDRLVRVEREGDAPDTVCRVKAQLLHICVARTFERIDVGPTELRAKPLQQQGVGA